MFVRATHWRGLLTGFTGAFVLLVSVASGTGWRYPYETCQWTVKGTAIETWTTTETEYRHIDAHAWAAVFCPPMWDSEAATATVGGNLRWTIGLDADDRQGSAFASASAGIVVNGNIVASYEIDGSGSGYWSGGVPVLPGDLVSVGASASVIGDEFSYGAVADARATADVPSRIRTIEHRTTVTTVSGPYFGAVNGGEGIKNMGTFPVQLEPQHGGTLSPTSYSLINVTPPAHGSIWVEPTSAAVFAQTSHQIRTWDLLVQSKNLQFGLLVGVAPEDNNNATDGTTPFIRVFDTGTTVVLRAPQVAECRTFSGWEDGTSTMVGTSLTLIVVMDSDKVRKAVYASMLLSPVLADEPPFSLGTWNDLAWSAIVGAQNYFLQWSRYSDFVPAAGNSGWQTATAFRARALTDGQQYYYRVKCRNAALEESAWSNVVWSRQDASPPTAPGTPLDDGQFTSSTVVRFRWTAATDSGSSVINYGMHVGTTPGSWDRLNSLVGNMLEKAVGGRHGETLYARVSAHDAVGLIGAWSEISDGITIDTVRPRLSNVAATDDVTLEISFDEPVRNADQTDSYQGSGGLQILHVIPRSETDYCLYTSCQRPALSYTLTVHNRVTDRAGNPIDPSGCSRSFLGAAPLTTVRKWRHYR